MKLHVSKKVQDKFNVVFENEVDIVDIDTFKNAVSFDHVFSKFINNKREIKNFISCDCLFGDIDNSETENENEWMTIIKFKCIFKDYEYYISTSRSHDIEKDGKKARPKFHVYFPIKEINDVDQLHTWLKKLTTKYKFFDQQVKDAARFFYGNPNTKVYYNFGKSILSDLYNTEIEKEGKVRTDREYIEEIKPGERNGYIFKLGCKYISEGFRESDVEKMLIQANDILSDPLDDNELKTIMKSVSKYFKEEKVPEGSKIIKNYFEEKIEYTEKDGTKKTATIVKDKLSYTEDMDEPSKLFSSFKDQSGQKYMFENTRPSYFINRPTEFHTRLVANGFLTDFTKGKEISASRYMSHIVDISKGYERFSLLKEISEKDDTLYSYEDIKPENNGWFKKMLDIMTFENEVDKYRYAAGLLSGFLNSSFDGYKPLFAVIAPSKSSGKTQMVRTGIQIVQGESPLEFIGDKEDEGQISGLRSLKNKYVIYDNLQYTTTKQMLKITTAVTDQYIPAWFMNISHARVRNNKTYWATFNSENAFNDDILNRIVVIRAKDGRETTTERKAEIAKLMDSFLDNREKVVADILYYLSIYDKKKEVEVKRHIKFSKWSEIMAKLLSNIFTDIKEFDFSLSDDDENLSQELVMVKDFIETTLADNNEVFIVNENMLEKYRLFYGDNRVTATLMARRLTNITKSLNTFTIEKDMKKINQRVVRGWSIKRR